MHKEGDPEVRFEDLIIPEGHSELTAEEIDELIFEMRLR
jgi:hypothetical protein